MSASKPARPKIRHLALFARDPEALAKFYHDNFDMEIVHRSPSGACFITDGYITLALLKHRLEGEAATGLNHFGFHVADTEAMSKKLVAKGLEEPKKRPGNRPYAEFRAVDPEGNWFDLSAHGFEEVRPQALADAKAKAKEPAGAK